MIYLCRDILRDAQCVLAEIVHEAVATPIRPVYVDTIVAVYNLVRRLGVAAA